MEVVDRCTCGAMLIWCDCGQGDPERHLICERSGEDRLECDELQNATRASDFSDPLAIIQAVTSHPGYPEVLPEGWHHDETTYPTTEALDAPVGMVAVSPATVDEYGVVSQTFAYPHSFIRADFGALDLGLVRDVEPLTLDEWERRE